MDAAAMLDVLRTHGVTHVLGVPDNWTAALWGALAGSGIDVITVCREGEAFAVAAGLWIGGCTPLVAIQNTGLLDAGDALRGHAVNMAVPLVVLVSYRGFATRLADLPDPLTRRGFEDTAAAFLEPTLAAWSVPSQTARDSAEAATALSWAFGEARRRSGPAAVLLAAPVGLK